LPRRQFRRGFILSARRPAGRGCWFYMLIKRLIAFFTSLKLTAALLAFSIILVFLGTLAQVDEGLYAVQANYFKHWLIIAPHIFGSRVPILLPGGYLLGTMLLINLISAHIYRFRLTTKKIGIQLAHLGIILLLVGQLATDLLSHEMHMFFEEGQTRSYSESATDYELVFINSNQVTSIPQSLLQPGRTLKIDSLPFDIGVKAFWKNSEASFRAPMMQNGPPQASNGVAQSFDFHQVAETKTTEEKNIPTATLELIRPEGSLGTWEVSDWTSDAAVITSLQNAYSQQGMDASMVSSIIGALTAPQSMEIQDKTYTFTFRPMRIYHPFKITLLQATHTVYPGTDIPKDFRSRVRLENPATGENREVEISMNHPLRYEGLTFYQYQMTAGDLVQRAGLKPSSVLSVVHNPSWLTPYIGCAMVASGLIVQFLSHLIKFINQRKPK